ncbi:hypothetical protein B2K_39135 [Paenibacillus mucilaginosus K02]|uniref:Uncharacterized protein n=1 Tax=Paenibacillus mucilaginosus K02 TaxID=997761 RepID=R9ULG7_9BACL|nr:hypothetical protein B2K_39135 [Paenibacillus mucilaginosus K02]
MIGRLLQAYGQISFDEMTIYKPMVGIYNVW